jgi:hypothetical protein
VNKTENCPLVGMLARVSPVVKVLFNWIESNTLLAVGKTFPIAAECNPVVIL